jgi:hypothetical protein
MKTHELKTWPVFYKDIVNGTKTFEVRKNDRNFQLGDILLLREYDPDAEQYTGAKTERVITYILGDNPFFQLNAMVILGISPLPQQEPERTAEENKQKDTDLEIDEIKNEALKYLNEKYPQHPIDSFEGVSIFQDFAMGLQTGNNIAVLKQPINKPFTPKISVTDEEIEKQALINFPVSLYIHYDLVSDGNEYFRKSWIQGAKWAISYEVDQYLKTKP